MSLEQFLTLIATIFGAVGSIYVLKSVLRLTPKVTERLSATMYGHNFNIIDSLSTQKAESTVGTGLIAVALFIAIGNAMAMPSNIVIHQNRIYAILLGVFISAIVYFLLWIIGNFVSSRHRLATARIIAAETLDRLFRSKSIPDYEIKTLRNLGSEWLKLKLSPDLTPKDLILLIARDVGCSVPDEIKIESKSQ